MTKKSGPIQSAVDLHKYLNANKNFHFNPDTGRDLALYGKLKQALNLPEGEFLKALEAQKVPAENYLRALIATAEPLAQMYQAILNYCERANFLKSKEGTKVEWKIAAAEERIGFTFEAFRLFEEIKTDIEPPSKDLMWETKNKVMCWLSERVFPPHHSGLPSHDLNWTDVGIFRILASARVPNDSTYPGLFNGLYNFYLNGTSKRPSAELKSRVTDNIEYPQMLSAVSKAFEPISIEKIASQFIELPFWKFRWQIYEIWIITVSIFEFESLGLRLVDNTCRDSLIELGRQAILARKESPSAYFIYQPTYLNRKNSEMRPDITVSSDISTSPDSVQLIIECKQRMNLDVAHLDDVREKYEAGVSASGQLVIINYDEAPSCKNPGSSLTTLIGNVYPNSKGEKEFRSFLRTSTVATTLRNEVWFVDVSISMAQSLDSNFRDFLTDRSTSLGSGKFKLYSFAQSVEERTPSSLFGEVLMSRSPDQDNWEGHGIASLCSEVQKFLSDESLQLFLVSDIAAEIQAALPSEKAIRIRFVNPKLEDIRVILEAT